MPLPGIDVYRTHASLLGVRRIQVSRGSTGHSRSSSHISGLWFDYYDERSPAIVGQWIDGYGAIELAPDEQLQRLIIWLGREGRPARNSRLDQGKIWRIHFDTTHGKSATFQPSGDQSWTQCIQQQYQSGLYEKLVSTTLTLRSSEDFINGNVLSRRRFHGS